MKDIDRLWIRIFWFLGGGNTLLIICEIQDYLSGLKV